jgi:hypothetical protein
LRKRSLDGYAADDNVALHFIDGKLMKVVGKVTGSALYLQNSGGLLKETRLETDIAFG